MRIAFTKMHGNGNDFVLIDATNGPHELSRQVLRRIADRHVGVGCDQVLVARPSAEPHAALAMQIFNTDGSQAEQCGNGLRCFAVFAVGRGLANGPEFRVETRAGIVAVQLLGDGHVRTNMGVPKLAPEQIPINAAGGPRYALVVDHEVVQLTAVSMGNPHAVISVDDIDTAPVAQLAPRIQAHPAFARGVNVGFMQVVDRSHVRLRVYERGVGETLACGTGACASVVAGILQGELEPSTSVRLPGGELEIAWQGPDTPVHMTGPTAHVFEGEMAL